MRFLENAIRRKFPFRGVPLKIELRKGSGEQTKEERLRSKREAALAILEQDRQDKQDEMQASRT